MAYAGNIRVPSDKSLSHRAVLFAGIASGTSHLRNLLPSDDVISSLEAMRTLGAAIELEEGPRGLSGTVTGIGGKPGVQGTADIDCGNSGTTTRLLMGLICGLGVRARLHGDASLSRRPMERVMKPLRAMGARFTAQEGGRLPLVIEPTRGLTAVSYTTEQASAQVKSAILLAGLQARGTTTVTEPAHSRDHTELLLPAFGVPVAVNGLSASVEGPARLHAHDMSVPGDPSSAAFIAVAAALVEGSDVRIADVALNETRIGALRVLERMGARISFGNRHDEGAEPVGDVRVRYSPTLRATTVAAAEIASLIDEIPVLALAAAAGQGETVFEEAGELRVKESDRFAAIIDMLGALGVRAFADGDDLHIVGGVAQAPASLQLPVYHDHRLAMTAHLLGKCFGVDVAVDDPDCVSVSWPSFYEDLAELES